PGKLQKGINHNFIDRTTVKDLIESFNVPHSEVDVILVNGNSVNFSYLIDDGDVIKVYPPDSKLQLKKLKKLCRYPKGKPKFICDVHLGSLAKNLRKLGLDVLYNNSFSDDEILKISIRERRVILTKDVGLLKRKDAAFGYFVRNTEPNKQTREILKVFPVKKYIDPFSRCLECGTKLKRTSREKAQAKLPDHYFEIKMKFYNCPNCDKIYWQGSHFEKMMGQINKFLKTVK
ncbi:MAG: Mut7-C RNAse domain-containing protein, partial [Ignavibacteria bacterium]